ncbi:MotE family protein [Novispirillum sp. DQ9]|uniref:MotE family protein n=1 Tax=Novispirillum sp. DQ9 TaxID=3398612 RepID=UPI003C7D44DD
MTKTGFKVPRLRLLPLVIFAAVLMLSVRLGGLWLDVERLVVPAVSVGQTTAHATGADNATGIAAPRNAAPVMAGGPQLAEAGGDGDVDAPVGQQLAAGDGKDGEEAPNPNVTYGAPSTGVDPLSDPTSFTQNEIDLLQRLAERREMIETREREMVTREGLLQAAEARIDRKIGELRQLEETINGLLKKHDEQEQEKMAQLVRIYATMKPKEAARIFDALDMPILISVMENMKESKSAAILAAMSVEKARALTEELTHRRRLPAVGSEGG